jgi:transcriptional regulator with XRE-family HTH domain
MLAFELLSAQEVANALAGRVRALRLRRGWTQVEAAARAGMTLASYKRFERTGEIAFKSLVKIAIALEQLDQFQALFVQPAYASLDEAIAATPTRVRAPRSRPK